MSLCYLLAERFSYRYQKEHRQQEEELRTQRTMVYRYCSRMEMPRDIPYGAIEHWFHESLGKEINDQTRSIYKNKWGRVKLMDLSNNLFLILRGFDRLRHFDFAGAGKSDQPVGIYLLGRDYSGL